MNIKATLSVINQLRDDGIVERYALGGAVAASLYLEPGETRDVDIFVGFNAPAESLLVSLTPIYDYLKAKGYEVTNQGILVAGWPVQFLPPDSSLVEEAIEEAVEKDIGGVKVTVFTAEHLAAIALKLGRPKDKVRLIQFWESGTLDIGAFQLLLERHALTDAWKSFRHKFFD